MGYRPNQHPARPTPPGRVVITGAVPPDPWRHDEHSNPIEAVWDMLRDGMRRSRTAFAGSAAAACTLLGGAVADVGQVVLVGVMLAVVSYGMAARAHVVGTRRDAARLNRQRVTPVIPDTAEEQRAALAVMFAAEPSAHRHDQPCACGSEDNAVPVEVHWSDVESEVVDMLCPRCGHRRTPKQLRVEAERNRQLADAAQRLTIYGSTPGGDRDLPSHVNAYEYEKARAALLDVAAKMDALVDRMLVAEGTVAVTREDHDMFLSLDREATALRRGMEQMLAPPAPGAAKPRPGLMIEQGEWVYEIPWHAEDDLCAEDDHEWNDLHRWGQTAPMLAVCSQCGAKRRPRLRVDVIETPLRRLALAEQARKAITAAHGACVACSGRGERFGYKCVPCGGTGRSDE